MQRWIFRIACAIALAAGTPLALAATKGGMTLEQVAQRHGEAGQQVVRLEDVADVAAAKDVALGLAELGDVQRGGGGGGAVGTG